MRSTDRIIRATTADGIRSVLLGERSGRERRDRLRAAGAEVVADVVPEGDAGLSARFREEELGFPGWSSVIALAFAAGISWGDASRNVVFESVGVKRDAAVFEHPRKVGGGGVQTGQQAAEGDDAYARVELGVEASGWRAPRRAIAPAGAATSYRGSERDSESISSDDLAMLSGRMTTCRIQLRVKSTAITARSLAALPWIDV